MFDFQLPFLNRPILWYGFLFAFGFFLGYLFLLKSLRHNFPFSKTFSSRTAFAEKLTLYTMIGTLIGARLGDLIFYQNIKQVISHPILLIAVWEGGLASHGGALGILVALFLFAKKYKISFWAVVDRVVIPASLAGACIRVGNFFNQEILGIPTDLPWGVLFLHPADGGVIIPRHPVQLYEALGYLAIFLLLNSIARAEVWWKRTGGLTGIFLVAVFSFRCLVEGVKVEQSVWIHPSSFFTMGQWLSLPFIFVGGLLWWRAFKKRSNPKRN